MDIWQLVIVALIVVAVVGGAVIVIGILAATRRRPDAHLQARVDDLETRLVAVEKTLNDIP